FDLDEDATDRGRYDAAVKSSFLALALVGCSPTVTHQADGGIDGRLVLPDAANVTFMLHSPVLAAGDVFRDENTCDGEHFSQALVGVGLPPGTMSLAVLLTDKTNNNLQWAIFDTPPTMLGFPAAVESAFAPTNVPGAHQTPSYTNNSRGYRGPCPPTGE